MDSECHGRVLGGRFLVVVAADDYIGSGLFRATQGY